MKMIDLNCDMGEGSGYDEAIMPYISSANIACGFHAGNPAIMNATVDLAINHGVAIGAHPSFYDIKGFGRSEMKLTKKEVYEIMVYQVSALAGFVHIRGQKLHHVKPHGALYNMAARDPMYAQAIAAAVKDIDQDLLLYGLSGSELINAGKEAGLKTCSEVFADRTYQEDGSLTPRSQPGAIISDFNDALVQVMMMIREQKVHTLNGDMINIEADTICIHGDHQGADIFAREMNISLTAAGFVIKAQEQYG
ncbi:MAG TPA: 5-oxoprolinase subunit PxpA [Chitinophagaceae bacterium]|nr:5-oxoprolinase subunit PxpA [Chitinophagaceae bacterium]